MAQLRQDYVQFAERNVAILVAGPEDTDAFTAFWEREKLPFIGLPDPETSVLKLYGQEVNLFKLGRMPAQVLIDKAGIARYAHYGESIRQITAAATSRPPTRFWRWWMRCSPKTTHRHRLCSLCKDGRHA
jgi:peroxiredoxin Q/BCP